MKHTPVNVKLRESPGIIAGGLPNLITAQFSIGSIKKVISQKYTYNSKATKIEPKSTEINLPVKSDGTPNYEYMALVISAMQKVVIKNVVDYLDMRIEKTVEILR